MPRLLVGFLKRMVLHSMQPVLQRYACVERRPAEHAATDQHSTCFSAQHNAPLRRSPLRLRRTDLPYADLLGPDPVPNRAHVFFVSSQDRPFDGALRHYVADVAAISFYERPKRAVQSGTGHFMPRRLVAASPDILNQVIVLARSSQSAPCPVPCAGHSVVSAAFWQAGLGRTRVTMLRGGRSAWVELQASTVGGSRVRLCCCWKEYYMCPSWHLSLCFGDYPHTAMSLRPNSSRGCFEPPCPSLSQQTAERLHIELQDAEVLALPDPAALVTTKLAEAPWEAEVRTRVCPFHVVQNCPVYDAMDHLRTSHPCSATTLEALLLQVCR